MITLNEHDKHICTDDDRNHPSTATSRSYNRTETPCFREQPLGDQPVPCACFFHGVRAASWLERRLFRSGVRACQAVEVRNPPTTVVSEDSLRNDSLRDPPGPPTFSRNQAPLADVTLLEYGWLLPNSSPCIR